MKIIPEAAAEGSCKQFGTVESEAAAASRPRRPIGNEAVAGRASPEAGAGFTDG
jgi:hypothetical protein